MQRDTSRTQPQISTTSAVRLSLAAGHIENKRWDKLKKIIRLEPGILNLPLSTIPQSNNKFESTPTILFFVQSHVDDSLACQQALELIMKESNWEENFTCFGNTLITYAIAMESKKVINRILDYAEIHKPHLMAQENKNHRDAKNTPLLMAIKNADVDTALRLIPYYEKKDLLSLSRQGNSALHLACYMKMGKIITAILHQAKIKNCLGSILNQKNSKGHTALALYQAEFEDAKPFFRKGHEIPLEELSEHGEHVIFENDKYYERVIQIGRETHDYIERFAEEITKHKFKYKKDSDKIVTHEIELALTPSYTHQESNELSISIDNISLRQENLNTLIETYGKGKVYWDEAWNDNFKQFRAQPKQDIQSAQEHHLAATAEALLICYGGLWTGTTYGSEVSSAFPANCKTLHEVFTTLQQAIQNKPIKIGGDLHTILKVIGEKVHGDEHYFVNAYQFNIVEREKKKSFYESFLSLFCCLSCTADEEESTPVLKKTR